MRVNPGSESAGFYTLSDAQTNQFNTKGYTHAFGLNGSHLMKLVNNKFKASTINLKQPRGK